MTRSKRKAIIFCENNTLVDDMIVCVRVILSDGKRVTYNCSPGQALNHMLKSRFVWFDCNPHI